ncbi:hypothetical protein H0H93_002307, partial [Arthromyces matolae]
LSRRERHRERRRSEHERRRNRSPRRSKSPSSYGKRTNNVARISAIHRGTPSRNRTGPSQPRRRERRSTHHNSL